MSLKSLWTAFYQRRVAGEGRRSLDHEKEVAILDEIEKIVRKTDSTILPLHRFRKRILPSVRNTIQYISGLIPQVPGPVDLDPGRWDKDPLLRAMFISREELVGTLQSSKALKNFFHRTNAPQAFAMLIADQKEKIFFGTQKNGEIFRRDVPQKAVFFENFKVFAPALELAETHLKVQHIALVTLFRQAFEKITDLESWKNELEKQKDLLEFKLRRSDTSEPVTALNPEDAPDKQMQETLLVLRDINRKLREIKAELDTPEHRLSHLCSVLKSPDQTLKLKTVSFKLSRMGVRLESSSTESANEFNVAELALGEDLKQSMVWVRAEPKYFLGSL
jgi:hypothetical protein